MTKSKCGRGKKKMRERATASAGRGRKMGTWNAVFLFLPFLRRRSDNAGAKGPLQEAYLHIKDGAEPSRAELD